VAPELRVDSGGTARQEVVTVNGLMIPVTERSLSVPSCLVAHGVTEDDAMDDGADNPAARDSTVPPVRRRALISSCGSVVVREASFILIGLSLTHILFLGIHCRVRVGSGRGRCSVAQGWGPGTREIQNASRDTIMERWGERTHSRTQAKLSLNRSALAPVRVQLPTLASGVCKTNFTLDISAAAASEEAAASRPCHS